MEQYVINSLTDELFRINDDGKEYVWNRGKARWTRLTTPRVADALTFGELDYASIGTPQAEEQYPDAFGGTYDGPKNPQVLYAEQYAQEPLTATETSRLLTYLTAGKTFHQYVTEQAVSQPKQQMAHEMWVSSTAQKLENPDVGFESPNEWA